MWNLLQDELGGGVWSRLLVVLVDTGAKGLILMAAAGLAAVALRRKAAAARHLVWMLALGGLLLLPVASLMMPKWMLPILPAVEQTESPVALPSPIAPLAAPSKPAESALLAPPVAVQALPTLPQPAQPIEAPPLEATPATQSTPPIDYPFWIVATYLLLALLSIAPFAMGVIMVTRMRRKALPFHDDATQSLAKLLGESLGLKRPTRLLQGPGESMPMATGFLRAAVFLPTEASDWPEEKRRAVLLHELAHVKRRDCLTHAIARCATSLHWFNPLAWLALRQLRIEREHACDDLVLAAGERPSAYAENLLEIARTLHANFVVSAAAITMAQKSQLEGRLLAVLDAARNRGRVTRKMIALGITTLCVVMGVLGALAITRESAAPGDLLAIAKPVRETTLEGFFGGWRNLPFRLSDGEAETIAQCIELSQRYNANQNGVNQFSFPDVREALETLLSKNPDFFYVEHYLGTWHQMNGNTSLAEEYFLRSYRHAPVVLIQRYEHADRSPITGATIRQFEVECNRVQGGNLDPSLNLKYFALTTDSEGCIYLPVYDTVYRASTMSFPEGFNVSYPKLGWFKSRAKAALMPACKETLDSHAGEFTLTYTSGYTAAIIGVSDGAMEHPDIAWGPDGALLSAVPVSEAGSSWAAKQDGKITRRFHLRIQPSTSEPKKHEFGVTFRGSPEDGSGAGGFSGPNTAPLFSVTLDAQRSETGFELGIATGPWLPAARIQLGSSGMYSFRGTQFDLTSSALFTRDDHSRFILTHSLKDKQFRVVAFDKNGKEYEAQEGSGTGFEDFRQTEYTLDALAPENLKELELQARDFEWRKFEGIALNPNNAVSTIAPPRTETTANNTNESAKPDDSTVASAFQIDFSGGLNASLVGVGDSHGADPHTFWGPDGTPIGTEPAEFRSILSVLHPSKDEVERVFLLQILPQPGGSAATDISARWRILAPSSSGSGGQNVQDKVRYIKAAMTITQNLTSADLELGIAAEPWVSVVEAGFAMSSTVGDYSVAVDNPYEQDGELRISVSHNVPPEKDCRLVVFDQNGNAHPLISRGTYSANQFTQVNYSLDGLSRESINRFELQMRDFEWKKFEGIALNPNDPIKPVASVSANVQNGNKVAPSATPDEPESDFSVEFTGGYRARVVSVRDAIGGFDRISWAGDGSPTEPAPTASGSDDFPLSPETIGRLFLVELLPPPDSPAMTDVTFLCTTESPGSGAGVSNSGSGASLQSEFFATFPMNTKDASVKVGAAAGPWKTVFSGSIGCDTGVSESEFTARFSKVFERAGEKRVTASHKPLAQERRVVAIDAAGAAHPLRFTSSVDGEETSQSEWIFQTVAPEDVKGLEIQVRDYEWRNIFGIALNPREKHWTMVCGDDVIEN